MNYGSDGWKSKNAFCGGNIGDIDCSTASSNFFSPVSSNSNVVSSIKKAFKSSAFANPTSNSAEDWPDFLINVSSLSSKTFSAKDSDDNKASITIDITKDWVRFYCSDPINSVRSNNPKKLKLQYK